MKLKYDINTPAPAWAILEARRRAMFTQQIPHPVDWNNCTPFLRHMAHLVALTEEAPIDPLVLKARKLYCVVNDLDEEFIEKSGGWEGRIRREAVARVVEFFNAEA